MLTLADCYGISATLKYDNKRKYWIRLTEKRWTHETLPDVFINVVKKATFECQTMPLVKLNVRLSDVCSEIVMRSDEVVQELTVRLREFCPELFRVCESVALVDMLCSFAHVAGLRDYCRPEFKGALALKGARHPILDKVGPRTS